MKKQTKSKPTTCAECIKRTSAPYYSMGKAYCKDCISLPLLHSQGNRIKETAIPFKNRKAGGDTERVAVEINSHESNTSSLDFKTAQQLLEEME